MMFLLLGFLFIALFFVGELQIKHRIFRCLIQFVLLLVGVVVAASVGSRVGNDTARLELGRQLEHCLAIVLDSNKQKESSEAQEQLLRFKIHLPLLISGELSERAFLEKVITSETQPSQ